MREHPTPIPCTCALPDPHGFGGPPRLRPACRVPHQIWHITRTSGDDPYPCLCDRGRPCSPRWCPCAGAPVDQNTPRACCRRVNTPAVVTVARKEYAAWKKRMGA